MLHNGKIDLINSDCLDALKSMEENSIDGVITSPPYNMNLRVRGNRYVSRQIVKEISTKYDCFDDNLTMEDYFEFNKSVIENLLRVSRGYIFYNIQQVTGNKPALYKLIGHFSDYIKEVIIWDKVNSQPAINSGVLNSQFEFLFILSKDAISRKFNSCNFERGKLSNVWQIKKERSYLKNHGAVFPTELVNKILKNFFKEGQIIMDPFMGTGTSGVCSIKMGMRFIGIEKDKKYFDAASRRIENLSIQESFELDIKK